MRYIVTSKRKVLCNTMERESEKHQLFAFVCLSPSQSELISFASDVWKVHDRHWCL